MAEDGPLVHSFRLVNVYFDMETDCGRINCSTKFKLSESLL